MAGKPATWAKGQRPVGQLDLGSETVEKVAIVDAAGNQITSFGGGTGAATIADGADVAQGTTTDLSSANTVVGILKAIKAAITGTLTISGTVTGPLTDTQLRASVVPVSLAAETTKVIGTVRNYDGLGNSFNSSGPGFLRTTDEPKQVFYDPFDGTFLDLTNRWTASYGLGAAVLPSQVSGTASINAGATSGGWARLISQPTFVPPIPAWLGGSAAISLSDGAAPPATGTRFWGFGSPALIPTTAAAVVDGVGFEMRSGKLYAVVYANSVRTDIADLSAATGTATQPTDALNHRYIVQVRTDRTYWYIDSLATPVATSSFQSPTVQTLPYTFVSVSGGSATQIDSAGIAVWDTGKNATQIADGISPWRKQTVKAGSAVPTTADNPAVVTIHPLSPPTAAQPVYDDLNRRLLEEILIEMRTNNALLMQVFPNGHLQADTRPDLRLAQ